MIIDMHAHMAYFKGYPGYFLDGMTEDLQKFISQKEGKGVGKNLVRNITLTTLKDRDGSKLVKQMEEAGIHKTVLLILDLGFETGDAQFSIDEIHEFYYQVLNRYPGKFIVFSGIDPRRGEKGLELFEKGIKEYNFKGLKLYPPCGYELDAPCLIPYYELCKHFGVPVLTHTGPSLKCMKNDYDYVSPVLELSGRFRDTVFILAHVFSGDFEANIRLALKRDNVYLDISAFQPHLHHPEALEEKVKRIFREIPDKIVFGTDWPVYRLNGEQKKWVDIFKNMAFIPPHQLEMFFYENAKNIIEI